MSVVNGTPRRICLFGNFGRGNLGNECTLEAMLYNVRRYLPDAELRCICKGPDETSSRYHIAASPMREMPGIARSRPANPVARFLKRMFLGIPVEIYRCVKAVRTLRDTDMLVMTGTGMLSDFGILPFDLHYDILRWSVIAKLCRCKLLFVSVGAGPIDHPLSRCFVKWALSLADYRSYRDPFSKEYLKSIGFDTNGDGVYPDLAFSLPSDVIPDGHNHDRPKPVVGVGLMTYYDGRRHTAQRGEVVHGDYIATVADFVTWLLEHDYTVRLVIGDVYYDRRVCRDLRRVLAERDVQYHDDRLIDVPISSADEVLSQLAAADVVVASRFHNVLFAMMLTKPVVAISYHEKVDALMNELGLQEYCHDIDHLDVDRLIGQLTTLALDGEHVKPQMKQRTEAYRGALDEQYDRIFGTVAH
jgi:polysaccharide pyruvyl transferase WcaK-like protein